MLALMLACC